MRSLAVLLITSVAVIMLMLFHRNFSRHIDFSGRASEIEAGPVPGTYSGTGRGFVDDIKVKVVFEENSKGETVMMGIDIESTQEIPKYWDSVKDIIIKKVIERQSVRVDSVTGATDTSEGLLEAIEDARKKAYRRD